ncbi:MAG: hypothetical protein AAFR38_13415 [Planctomycetota bacterium]
MTRMSSSFAVLILAILVGTAEGQNLVVNGDFSAGLSGWRDESSIFSGGGIFNGTASVVDSGSFVAALELSSTTSGNYRVGRAQTIELTESAESFGISFDWRVTESHQSWGRSQIDFEFYGAAGEELGKLRWSERGPNYGETQPGRFPPEAFSTNEVVDEVFDWTRVSIDTSTLIPGLDEASVARIEIRLFSSNDAGSGGVVLFDNISVTPSPGSAGVVFVGYLAWSRRRR